MTLRSMTGFGSAQCACDGWTVTVQCRSVNHRSLDINLNAPSSFLSQELAVRNLIKKFCGRGRIDYFLSIEHTGPIELTRSARSQVREIHLALEAVKEELGLDGPIELGHLLAAGLNPMGLVESQPESQATVDLVNEATNEALSVLVGVREKEGQVLRDDFLRRLDLAESLLAHVQENAPVELEAHRERLARKVLEWMQPLGGNPPVEPERIYREVAVLLERSDITEELVRAFSHVEALRSRVRASYLPGETAGKGIDFFLQELAREVNTISAKCSGATMTSEVVQLKLEAERMREQAQNIE